MSEPTVASHAALEEVVDVREQTPLQKLFRAQSFWVAVALVVLMLVMTALEPTFGSAENLGNISRNFAPFGIMALGMTMVLITGGIDLSIGSLMGLVAIIAGLFLTWHHAWYVALSMGMLTGLACGVVNGFLVAYLRMPSFVATLGMMSIARSLAIVFSGNQMLYQFGPDAPIVKAIGQAKWPLRAPGGWAPSWMPEFSSHFWTLIVLTLIVGWVFNFTAWARHLFAIGGNEDAARLTGVPVDKIKFQAYVFSAFTASVAALLLLGYNGSA
ncbi:MAG: ABC transporter permease, partial [Mesorhizobium sp.]